VKNNNLNIFGTGFTEFLPEVSVKKSVGEGKRQLSTSHESPSPSLSFWALPKSRNSRNVSKKRGRFGGWVCGWRSWDASGV